MKNLLIAVTICVFGLSSCTKNAYTDEQQVSKTGIGAGAGALVGGLLGAVTAKNSEDAKKRALVGAGIGAVAGGGIGLYMDYQEAKLRERLRGTGVSVTRVGNNIILNMPSNITFDVDRSEIKSQFFDVLNSVAIVLAEYDKTAIEVSGHTDSDGSDSYNLGLSQSRAESVARYLISQQIAPNRFSVQGYGERYPVASNATSAGKAQNRRVEIKLTPIG